MTYSTFSLRHFLQDINEIYLLTYDLLLFLVQHFLQDINGIILSTDDLLDWIQYITFVVRSSLYLQCQHLIPALNVRAARAWYTTERQNTTKFHVAAWIHEWPHNWT